MRKPRSTLKKATINRVAALGYILCLIGPITIIYAKSHGLLSLICSGIIILSGVLFIIDPDMSGKTYKTYERTKNHIKRFNRLDRRFVTKLTKDYCARQGVYMAAKELNHLPDYKRIISQKRIILPNF